MSYLLAAITSYVLKLLTLIFLVLLLSGIIFVVLLALVLADLAAISILRGLPATPPHFSRVLTRVRPARPVVVLLLQVFFATFFANLLVVFYPEPLILEFLDSGFELAIL
jgi:hypothetical protein